MLLNASVPDPIDDLRQCLASFRRIIDDTSLVVGITHNSSHSERVLRPAVAQELAKRDLPAIVMTVDARVRTDMTMLVKALIYSLDPLYGAA